MKVRRIELDGIFSDIFVEHDGIFSDIFADGNIDIQIGFLRCGNCGGYHLF